MQNDKNSPKRSATLRFFFVFRFGSKMTKRLPNVALRYAFCAYFCFRQLFEITPKTPDNFDLRAF